MNILKLLRDVRGFRERSRGNPHRHRRLGAAGLVLLAPLAVVAIALATAPEASFNVSDSNPTIGDPVTFTSDTPDPDSDGNAITSIAWDFEDDGTIDDTGPSATHSYLLPGTKTVRIFVTDDAGEIADTAREVTVSLPPNQPPTAAFEYSPSAPVVGDEVLFDASRSSDPEGDTLTYDWDLDGDGSFGDSDSLQPPPVPIDSRSPKTVTLRVSDGGLLTDEVSHTVTVQNRAPTAAFTFTQKDAEVKFDGRGSNDPDGDDLTYDWDLNGDGNFGDSSSAQPTFPYSSAGPRTVRLVVSDGELDSPAASQVVTVNAKPHASFKTEPRVPLVGALFTLDGRDSSDPDGDDIVSYEWNVDSDSEFEISGPSPQVTHSFSTGGSKTIKLRVTDAGGAQDDTTETVRINAPPVARIVFSPAAPDADDLVSLSGGTSSDPDNNSKSAIKAFRWDFDGDGQFDDAQGEGAQRKFSGDGLQYASLQVTDSDDATATATVRINRKPLASFISNNETPITNERITFAQTATDIDGDGLEFAWDLDNDGQFDDGTQGSVSHAFSTAGTKTVRLRVTDAPRDAPRAQATAKLEVRVENTRPDAAFSASPEAPLPGQLVVLSSTSRATAGKSLVRWDWDLDNDRQYDDASGPSVNWSFATPGIKNVALRVEETGGGIDIVGGFLVVNAGPTASFTSSPGNPFAGDGVTFSSTSADPDGPIAAQHWDLDDDGQFDDAAGETAIKAFDTTGTHTVRLQVTDSRGAVAMASGTVTVIARPLSALRLPWEFGAAVRRVAPFTTRIKLLSVRAPSGAAVTVRCKGRGCPDGDARRKGRQQMRISTRGRGARRLRFKRLERRYRPGATISVTATKLGLIGKQQTWTIRRSKAPRHRELCVFPEAARAGACPGS